MRNLSMKVAVLGLSVLFTVAQASAFPLLGHKGLDYVVEDQLLMTYMIKTPAEMAQINEAEEIALEEVESVDCVAEDEMLAKYIGGLTEIALEEVESVDCVAEDEMLAKYIGESTEIALEEVESVDCVAEDEMLAKYIGGSDIVDENYLTEEELVEYAGDFDNLLAWI